MDKNNKEDAGQPHRAVPRSKILSMPRLSAPDLLRTGIQQRLGKHRNSVFRPFPVAHKDLAAGKFHILDTKTHTLHQPL